LAHGQRMVQIAFNTIFGGHEGVSCLTQRISS